MKNIKHFFSTIFCSLGFHDYEIVSFCDKKGKLVNYGRICNTCEKEQHLEKPKEYHPSKYVWVDNIKHKNNNG
jgi:hypothetical protein